MAADGLQGQGRGAFQTLDVTRFRQAMAKLHETVGCSHGRIEITRRGCADVCVLISKAELEALERAMEILAECAEYKAMCENISQLVAECAGCEQPDRQDEGGVRS